jgi:hypothetical protein
LTHGGGTRRGLPTRESMTYRRAAHFLLACAFACGPMHRGLTADGGDVHSGSSEDEWRDASPIERIDGAASGAAGIGPAGGRVAHLRFVVVGDTRPPTVDDTGAYPSAIIARIFQDAESLDPVPLFGISTGDYTFASPRGEQIAPQLDLYLRARSAFSGMMFPAMGNHECTGATASNCGPGNVDGITENYAQFLSRMLGPLGISKPYYCFRVDSATGAWTAKFVFVAANAWDGAQATWLAATLAQKTTYTFVVRHEPATATAAPGVSPSEGLLSGYPYTLAIVGHSHTYARSGPKEVIIGNGGAPLTSSAANYGLGVIEQRPDGAIQVDVIDYVTMKPDANFSFAVRADGSPVR